MLERVGWRRLKGRCLFGFIPTCNKSGGDGGVDMNGHMIGLLVFMLPGEHCLIIFRKCSGVWYDETLNENLASFEGMNVR